MVIRGMALIGASVRFLSVCLSVCLSLLLQIFLSFSLSSVLIMMCLDV